MALVLLVFMAYTYKEVEAHLIRSGEDRARNAADQLADLLAQSAQVRAAEMRRMTSATVIIEYQENPSAANRAAAEMQLRALLTGSQHQTLELWSGDGERLISLASPVAGNATPAATRPTAAGMAPLTIAGNNMLVTEIVLQAGPGLVSSRRVAAISATPDILNRLVGSDAIVLVGNQSDHVWTDFSSAATKPPIDSTTAGPQTYVGDDGSARLGALALIRGTPWAVWVEFPRAIVVAPLWDLMGRLVVIGLTVVGLALVGVWALSARVTQPLGTLTEAVGAFAAGDYSQRVDHHSSDEVGRLGTAFNSMAGQLAAGRRDLEARAKALAESEAHKSAVVNGALDGILTLDHEGTITDMNPAAERVFGCPPDAVLGRSVTELVTLPGLRPGAFPDYVVDADMLGRRLELAALKGDGAAFIAEVSLAGLRTDDRPTFSAFVRDLTEQKAAERAKLRSVQLEEENLRVQEASRLKSEFLANMSHELRTPLNAIIGFAELLHDGQVSPEMPQFREFLGDILTSGQHLLQLINDVLDLSKVEAGRLEFHPEEFDIEKAVVEVLANLRTVAASKRLVVGHEVEPAVREVLLDRGRLKQVLYNYVSNAIKFTPDGGRVTVRVTAEDAERLRIEVADTGIGIAPEDIERLFIEFNQLEAGAAKKHQGTGLGLALTKRLVESRGGRVGVRSIVGQGSVFWVVVPRRSAPGTTVLAPRSFNADRAGAASVLVIEDNRRDQDLLVSTLIAAGFAVDTASTGAQAIDKLDTRVFDAITLDLILPDADGADILKHLRASEKNRNVPVIVITMAAIDGAVAGFAVQDLLSKPVNGDDLLAALTRAGLTARHGGDVLVIDDDPGSLRLMAASLDQLGYRSTCVERAALALEICRRQAPAAVILDLQMPEMDGFGFLDQFRSLAHCQRTPVIIWTVTDVSQEDYARLRTSAQGIMAKGQQGSSSVVEQLRRFTAPQATA